MLEDDRILGLGRPSFPDDSKDAVAEVHKPDGFAVLERAPAIGTKFHPAEDLGPSSNLEERSGIHRGAVWIYPGPEPQVIDPLDLHGTETGFDWQSEQ